MATTSIQQFEFNDTDGKPVKYERLCLSGYVNGEIFTLELKLEKSELLLAKMILTSKEEKPTTDVRHATQDEKDSLKVQRNTSSDLLDDDGEDWLNKL